MLLKQLYLESLGHASYFVGSEETGESLVLDVRRDVGECFDEARRHAEQLRRTLQGKILKLPDHVEVYPTHVAGSLCGGTIGSRLSTTIGYERRMNHPGQHRRQAGIRARVHQSRSSAGGAALLAADAQAEHRGAAAARRAGRAARAPRRGARPAAPAGGGGGRHPLAGGVRGAHPRRAQHRARPDLPDPGGAPCCPRPARSCWCWTRPRACGRRSGTCCAAATICPAAGSPAACGPGGPPARSST